MGSYIGSSGTFEVMRNLNLEKIYRLILLNQPISRAQLAQLSGSNKVTVSNCVDFLLEKGIVHELGVVGAGKGRPATLISINGDSGVLVGIEMNIPFIRVIVTSLSGVMLENIILPDIGSDPEAFTQQVSATITMLEEMYKVRKLGVIGVGFAFPGYNPQTGVIEQMPKWQTWNKFPILKEMQKYNLGIPLFFRSTVQAATMGEIHFGKANPFEQLVYLSGTWGISASVYSNGALISGHHGLAGRIGHFIIQANGKQCICGSKGCLEEYGSIRALFNKLYPGKLQHHKYIREILERVRGKDPVALVALHETVQYLAIGVVNVINAFNPSRICIGGYLGSIIDDSLLNEIKTIVAQMLPKYYWETLDIYCSNLGELGVAYGCIAVVRDQLISILVGDSAIKK
ncbi:MAG: rok family protein [Pelosinus sp.]|nr:rok family protein [Pelosinus sp.]